MTYSSQYYMPGAFFDSQGSSGVHPSVFRPPVSPSASSSVHLGKSTVSVQSEATTPAAHAKRKRAWNGPSQGQQQQPSTDDGRIHRPADHDRFPLAGQLETPGGFQGDGESTVLEESVYSDYDFRRALGTKLSQTAAESPASGQPTLLIKPVQPQAGWSRTAFNTLGGVVGKVWEFCRTGAFKGFYAGGGTGYSMDTASPHNMSNGATTESPHDYFSSRNAGDSTPVPGDFPHGDYMPDGCNTTGTTTPDATPSRPTKRRQISGADDILKNWVVVDEATPGEKGRPSSRVSARTPGRVTPSRNSRPSITTGRRISVPVSRLNSTPGPNRRTSHRVSHAGPPALSTREPASFAGMRSSRPASPPPPSPSPSRIPIPVSAGREPNPYTSPRPSSAASAYRTGGIMSPTSSTRPGAHRRTHSGALAASGRGPREDENPTTSSPRLTDEARRLAAKRRREEKDNDLRMNDFNSRLQAMIRQGKEALGTKIEVDGDGAGGGWESDE